MTPAQYARAIAELIAQLIRVLLGIFNLIQQPRLTDQQWLGVLNLVYPHVESARTEAARLAREMYDHERNTHVPQLMRNQQPQVGSDFQEFVRSMEPARKRMSQVDTRQKAIGMITREVVKQVENAGRRQIIRSIEADEPLALEIERQLELEAAQEAVQELRPDRESTPVTRIVRGWARVATGRETCAWCLMLISRGPVYESAKTGGLAVSDEDAQRMYSNGEDLSVYMNEWHPNCDCKVIPVFRTESWPGKEAADRALELWKQANAEASEYRRKNPGRVHLSGKNRGDEFTFNEDVINALRRMIDRGEINPYDYAGLAA